MIPIVFSRGLQPAPSPEISPASVGATTWITTDHTYRCRWQGGAIHCGTLVTAPEPEVWWRRSYAGVFDAERIAGKLTEFVHGENKNEIASLNTISGDRTCYSGPDALGHYRECWQDYYAAVSMIVDGRDLGPIVWPSDAYLHADRTQASNGVRHPTSILHAGYVYVFFLDTRRGICVARAPITELRPGAFRTWTRRGWKRSLPPGFSRRRPDFTARGPDCTPILGSRDSYFFAAVRTGRQYLALEWGSPTPGTVATTLWRSHDLLHWYRRGAALWASHAPDTASAFDASSVRYPRPLGAHVAIATTGTSIERVTF